MASCCIHPKNPQFSSVRYETQRRHFFPLLSLFSDQAGPNILVSSVHSESTHSSDCKDTGVWIYPGIHVLLRLLRIGTNTIGNVLPLNLADSRSKAEFGLFEELSAVPKTVLFPSTSNATSSKESLTVMKARYSPVATSHNIRCIEFPYHEYPRHQLIAIRGERI